jgi:signal recognition particle GTPase
VSPGDAIVKIVQDELTNLMGPENVPLNLEKKATLGNLDGRLARVW